MVDTLLVTYYTQGNTLPARAWEWVNATRSRTGKPLSPCPYQADAADLIQHSYTLHCNCSSTAWARAGTAAERLLACDLCLPPSSQPLPRARSALPQSLRALPGSGHTTPESWTSLP